MLLLLLCQNVFANTISSISSRQSDNATIVKIELSSEPSIVPVLFEAKRPLTPKIIIDLVDTDYVTKFTELKGSVKSAVIVSSNERTRIILNMSEFYLDGNIKMKIVKNVIFIAIIPSAEDAVITNKYTSVELLTMAKKVIADKGDIGDAIESLNAILLMPIGAQTMEAQELIGYAKETDGKFEQAKSELNFYLKTYPNSPRYKIVQQHLITLEIAAPREEINRFAVRTPHQGTDTKASASVSSYYYASSNSPSLTEIKQTDSSVISNLRADGTYRNDEYTTKVQVRYSRNDSLSNPSNSRGRLSNAFVDVRNTFLDWEVKAGRLSSYQGVLGSFDGGIAKYDLNSKATISVVAGIPIITGSETKRTVYGSAFSYNFDDASLSLYYNEQTADGNPERRAIGVETGYYKNDIAVNGVVEYDTLYRSLNTVMIHANIRSEFTNPYILYERRKSPVLYAERATVLGFGTSDRVPFTSVGEVFAKSGLTADQIYAYIKDSTPMSSSFAVGTTTPINNRWSVGVGLQVTNIAPVSVGIVMPTLDLPEAVLEQDGSGNTYSFSGSLNGQDILTKSSNLNLILTANKDKVSSSQSVTFANSFDTGKAKYELLSQYLISQRLNAKASSLLLSGRINYSFGERLSLDSAISVVRLMNQDDMTGIRTISYNQTFYIGLRTDF